MAKTNQMNEGSSAVLDAPKIEKPAPTETVPVMPYVETGMTVHWYKDGDRNGIPCVAVVTTVATRSLALCVLYPGYSGFEPHDGVRHVDDPDFKEFDNDEGSWEHTAIGKQLVDLVGRAAGWTTKQV